MAPGWALTCAHVLRQEGGQVAGVGTTLGLTFPGGTLRGEVACALPALDSVEVKAALASGQIYPQPDIALIRVLDRHDHPCVWLSDRPMPTEGSVASFGCSELTGSLETWTGQLTVVGTVGSALRLNGDQIPSGVSGGPIVDLDSGEVIGVVKAQRNTGDGGLAVPITELRRLPFAALPADGPLPPDLYQEFWAAHDHYHFSTHANRAGQLPTWTDVQSELRRGASGALRPELRTEMYALLAELPRPNDPASVLSLVDEVLHRRWLDEGPHPRSWRDGAGLLYDPPPGTGELSAFLHYCSLVAGSIVELPRQGRPVAAGHTGPVAALRAWVAQISDRLPVDLRPPMAAVDASPGRAAAGRARASVLIDVDQVLYEEEGETGYDWRVSLLYACGETEAVAQSKASTSKAKLWEQLRAPVAKALRLSDVGFHLAPVELALPLDLFDEPVDQWRIAGPARQFTTGGRTLPEMLPLGLRRSVVVRDVERFKDAPSPEWRARWHGVSDGPLRPIPLCGKGQSPDWNSVYATMSQAHPASVPVLCGRAGVEPGSTAMDAALAAGHAVAIWHRCQTPGAACEAFHQGVEDTIGTAAKAKDLPEEIRKLRLQASWTSEGHWSSGIALLFDDPDRVPQLPQPLPVPR